MRSLIGVMGSLLCVGILVVLPTTVCAQPGHNYNDPPQYVCVSAAALRSLVGSAELGQADATEEIGFGQEMVDIVENALSVQIDRYGDVFEGFVADVGPDDAIADLLAEAAILALEAGGYYADGVGDYDLGILDHCGADYWEDDIHYCPACEEDSGCKQGTTDALAAVDHYLDARIDINLRGDGENCLDKGVLAMTKISDAASKMTAGYQARDDKDDAEAEGETEAGRYDDASGELSTLETSWTDLDGRYDVLVGSIGPDTATATALDDAEDDLDEAELSLDFAGWDLEDGDAECDDGDTDFDVNEYEDASTHFTTALDDYGNAENNNNNAEGYLTDADGNLDTAWGRIYFAEQLGYWPE